MDVDYNKMTTTVKCAFCGEPCSTTGQGAMRQIRGWEELRKRGGANKITLRQETGLWAHRACVQLRQSRCNDVSLF